MKEKRLAWWRSQFRKRKCVETRIQPGIRMLLYFDSRLCECIYTGDFEKRERQFVNAFLRLGDVFIDVGANIGLFTLVAARRVGNMGRVYSFEPCSKTFRRLLANVKLNNLSNVTCHRNALSDCKVNLNLNISANGHDAWNSLAQPIAGSSFRVESVGAVRWDDFARQHDLVGRVTMMKIDVEGWEARVLKGATEALSRRDAPVLQVEFTERAASSAGSSCTELYHILGELGYQMFIYDAKSRSIIRDPLRESYPYMNLIATKNPELVAFRLADR